MQDLYREEILELYRHPENFGKIKKPTVSAYKTNQLCGDEIELQLLLNQKKLVKEAKFTGSGCVISTVAASLLTEKIKGMSLKQLSKISPAQILKLFKTPISPSRRKCALLPFDALQEILKPSLTKERK